eukprot:augustus_masked-scaffold_10-processed-gene-12.5-mRNA-1 protein AED:1.00 eAED:1.00 QI:0/-1/0/0/-1/1/1/0/824
MKSLLSLACFTTLSQVHSQIFNVFIDDVSLFAGQDSIAQSSSGDADAPDVVLVDELLFLQATVSGIMENATEAAIVQWSLDVDGVEYQQADVTVDLTEVDEGDTFSVLLQTAIVQEGVDEDEIIKFTSRGTGYITVNVNIPSDAVTRSDSSEISAYVITGFESLLPLISLVIFALLSRNVHLSMFLGIWVGSFIIEAGDLRLSFIQVFDKHIFPSILDDYNFRTITFTLFLGGFIALIRKSGGQQGFTNLVGKLATSAKATQLAAVLAGVGLFFDDYSSALILGSSFKTLMDKFHVSREKLAFVVDSTSAPIASISPISSWIAFELGLIGDEIDKITTGSAFQNDISEAYPLFINTLPSRFYPIFMLIIQVTLIVAGIEFGPMLYAERRTRVNLSTDGGPGRMELPVGHDKTEKDDKTPANAHNFFIPLLFFLCTLLASMIQIGRGYLGEGDAETLRNIFGSTDAFYALIYSTAGASIFTALFYLLQSKEGNSLVIPTPTSFLKGFDCRFKTSTLLAQEGIDVEGDEVDEKRPLMYLLESVEIWIEGFKNLVPSILVLCLAFTIKSIVQGAATDRFFTDIILRGDIAPENLPTIVFIVACLLSFCTGTSWGTMSIMFPLVGFASWEASSGDETIFTLVLSAILAGAIFGDHCSILSDTTILSSIGSGCQITAHVWTQIPYACWGALFAVMLGLLPAGHGAPAAVMLVIGAGVMLFLTLLVGAPIVASSGRLDVFSELFLKITGSPSLKAYKEETQKFAAERPDLVNTDFVYNLAATAGIVGAAAVVTPEEEEEIKPVEAVKVEDVEAVPAKIETTEEPASKDDL